MRRYAIVVFAATVLGFAQNAHALNDWQATNWASACFSCHGPDGRSEGGMPAIASLSADVIYRAMIDFKSGARSATVMHRHARGYTDEQLRRIADAIADPDEAAGGAR
jgi:cytochrome c553